MEWEIEVIVQWPDFAITGWLLFVMPEIWAPGLVSAPVRQLHHSSLCCIIYVQARHCNTKPTIFLFGYNYQLSIVWPSSNLRTTCRQDTKPTIFPYSSAILDFNALPMLSMMWRKASFFVILVPMLWIIQGVFQTSHFLARLMMICHIQVPFFL